MAKKSGPHMDMLLIFPPGGRTQDVFPLPLGGSYVAAYLNQNGISCELYGNDRQFSEQMFCAEVAELNPRIIGFTCFYSNITQCAELARALKQHLPESLILFGGPGVLFHARELLEAYDHIDFMVLGPGEEVCLDLAKTALGEPPALLKEACMDIPNLAFRVGDKIIFTETRDIFAELPRDGLDRYPSPYLSHVVDGHGPLSNLGIITARGCNQNCTYCNCATLSRRRLRTHSVERVVAELEYLSGMEEVRSQVVNIWDDAFTLIPSRAAEICEEILRRKIDLKLSCLTRADCMDSELLHLMRSAGFVGVTFALESATPEVLRNIGKVQPPGTTKDPEYTRERKFILSVAEGIGQSRELGFPHIALSVMLGLPGESRKHARDTLDMVKSLDADRYLHNPFRIFRGTPIYDDHERWGYELAAPTMPGVESPPVRPIDTTLAKLPPLENSKLHSTERNLTYELARTLAQTNGQASDCFSHVVIEGALDTQKGIEWLRRNASLTGTVSVVVPPDEEGMNTARDLSLRFRDSLFSPSYFADNGRGRVSVISDLRNPDIKLTPPMLMAKWDDYAELAELSRIPDSLNAYGEIIMEDYDKADQAVLFALFDHLRMTQEPFMLLAPLLKAIQVSRLCRWSSQPPNCETMGTAYIRGEKVGICRGMPPVATLDDDYHEIRTTLIRMKEWVAEESRCSDCPVNAACNRCLFPDYMNRTEYCGHKRRHGIQGPAEYMHAYYVQPQRKRERGEQPEQRGAGSSC